MMLPYILVCIAGFCLVVFILRRDAVSFGLPVAYLGCLLGIHLPGALLHMISGQYPQDSMLTELGMYYTTIGVVCFVLGVGLSRYRALRFSEYLVINRDQFCLYCLLTGWVFACLFGWFVRIPTLTAVVDRGGALWMLGVMLGLRSAVLSHELSKSLLWIAALVVYPVLMLLVGGFLGYGTITSIIVISMFSISTRNIKYVILVGLVISFMGFNVFLNYFQQRDQIRAAVWGQAVFEDRIDAAMNIVREFKWFDPEDERHLNAVNDRLNQNYFVGLAATRIQDGHVSYLYGRSVWEGVVSLVPRIFWPDKPVFGGSPKIVREMTGLILDENTSWGVGNVMEFQINFGTPGVVGGFLGLGWLLGLLDRKAALADCVGELSRVLLFFLPAVALVQPEGSLVELTGGFGAAFVAALFWQAAWAKYLTLVNASVPKREAITSL